MFRFFCLFYVFSGRNEIQHFIIIIMQIRIFENIQIEINGVCTQYVYAMWQPYFHIWKS